MTLTDPYDDWYGTGHHDTPHANGGGDGIDNIVPAHRICNLRQGNKTTPVVNRKSRQWV